jgi:hypothetical protein
MIQAYFSLIVTLWNSIWTQPIDISMCLDNNRISNSLYTKFLGQIVDNTIHWKPHIDHLINKLSNACYVIRSVKAYVNTNAIIMIYHSLFPAVMTYGIIFWGNSSHSIQLFGPGVALWLRHCATSQKVPGSIPGRVTGDFFQGIWQVHVPGVNSAP